VTLPLLPLLLAAVVAGPVPAPDDAGEVSVAIGETTVVLRGGEQDVEVRGQVLRLLGAAVWGASRFGALPGGVVLTVHATHAGLERASGRANVPWMRAWARRGAVDLQSPRTWSRGSASDRALLQVLTHELAHCVLFQAAGRDGRARDIPPWFTEGMASVSAGERHAVARADAVRDPGPVLRSDPAAAYGTADRTFRELLRLAGEAGARGVVARLGAGRDFASAFEDAVGIPLARFEAGVERSLSAVAAAPVTPASGP
jgi:hypothetical protein